MGDVIGIGSYEQDGKSGNGKETIEWEVLEVKDGKALLVSRYVLDSGVYHSEKREGLELTWVNCDLRSWINNDFYNNAFGEAEKTKIVESTIKNPTNVYNNKETEDTTDKIFLLSTDEIVKYYGFYDWDEKRSDGYSEQLIIAPSPCCESKVLKYTVDTSFYNEFVKNYYSENAVGKKGSFFWVRSPYNTMGYAWEMAGTGYGDTLSEVDSRRGIRPAMWVNLE